MTQGDYIPEFYKFLDLLPSISDQVKNISLLGGTGDGWPATLAFNPCDTLILKGAKASPKKLIDFTNRHKGKLVVGFISYDFGNKLLEVESTKLDDLGLPDIYFLAYENYLVDENGIIKNYGQKLPITPNLTIENLPILDSIFQPIISRSEYSQMFNKTQKYIKSGHIYQLNLTHRLQARSSHNARQLFAQYAKSSRAGMMGLIEANDFQVLSFSPERFVKTVGRDITTAPIKGTIVKNHSAVKQLLADPKEKSELSMITDLLRNDLSKISETGSVQVTKQRSVQSLTNIVHTFSNIAAKLKPGIEPIEALLSMSPGGSITGCPKRRAMQIIDELEPVNRGIYCGSLVCIDPKGNLDSSILIRTIIKTDQILTLPVGGGIVFDSDKNKEYQETLDKAESIIRSFQ